MNIRELVESAIELAGSLKSFKTATGQLENLLSTRDAIPFELLMLWRANDGTPRARSHHGRIEPRQQLNLFFPCQGDYDLMPVGTWVVARGPIIIRTVQLGGYEQLLGNGSTLFITSTEHGVGNTMRVMVEGLEDWRGH